MRSLFFVSSATFTTFGIISRGKAEDARDKLNDEYVFLSEDRVIYQGKYQKFREREKIFASSR